jgi:hypothetical protein
MAADLADAELVGETINPLAQARAGPAGWAEVRQGLLDLLLQQPGLMGLEVRGREIAPTE